MLAPERLHRIIVESPVLDHALAFCAAVGAPVLALWTYGLPLSRRLSRGFRRVRRGRGLVRDLVFDWLSMDPEPNAAALQGIILGGPRVPRNLREAIEVPTLVIGHRRDPVHPVKDDLALAREVRNQDPADLDSDGAWNPPGDWVNSTNIANMPLVSERDFIAAQAIRAARPAADGTARRYLLTGLVLCGVCERRMDAHWLNGRPGYRCRHGHGSSQRRDTARLKYVYVREDKLLAEIAAQQGPADNAEALADELRTNHVKIICSPNGCTLTDSPTTNAPSGMLF